MMRQQWLMQESWESPGGILQLLVPPPPFSLLLVKSQVVYIKEKTMEKMKEEKEESWSPMEQEALEQLCGVIKVDRERKGILKKCIAVNYTNVFEFSLNFSRNTK